MNSRAIDVPGLLQGVTVGEKFGPAGVFNALSVTALIPRSFNIDASPELTENVEHEFLLDNPCRGVEGALQASIISIIIYIALVCLFSLILTFTSVVWNCLLNWAVTTSVTVEGLMLRTLFRHRDALRYCLYTCKCCYEFDIAFGGSLLRPPQHPTTNTIGVPTHRGHDLHE